MLLAWAYRRLNVTSHLYIPSVSHNFKGLFDINSSSDEKELASKTIEEGKKNVSLLVLTIT